MDCYHVAIRELSLRMLRDWYLKGFLWQLQMPNHHYYWPIDLWGYWIKFLTYNFQYNMGLLPDMQNCVLRMRRECRERFPRHRLHRKPLVSDPGMHHDTCVTHVPWCMSGSLTRGGGGNVPGTPGACTTRNFTYLVRSQWLINGCGICYVMAFGWISLDLT